MNRLGVIGWPVAHSRSPALQNAALEAAGLGAAWHYQLLPIPPELFEETVVGLPADGFVGVNVTIPYKERALALARSTGGAVSPRAAAIGAANTLLFRAGGTIDADNTDAPALAEALTARGGVGGATVLVLGAGGSARAAVWALLDAGAGEVRVWNRTGERARELCAEIGGTAVADLFIIDEAEILVNCTSVGLEGSDTLGVLALTPDMVAGLRVVVDFVYHRGGTPLIRAATAAGVATIDGIELLVGQGALAFAQFTGCPAPVAAMRAAVRLSSAT